MTFLLRMLLILLPLTVVSGSALITPSMKGVDSAAPMTIQTPSSVVAAPFNMAGDSEE